MARAMKCDRCGGFYDIYDGCQYLGRGNYYNKLCLSSNAHACVREFDLCPNCMEALMSFMKGGKNDVKETL